MTLVSSARRRAALIGVLAVVLALAVAVMHTRATSHTGSPMAPPPVPSTQAYDAVAAMAMTGGGPTDHVGVSDGTDPSRHTPLGCGTHDVVCAAIANHATGAAPPTAAGTTDPTLGLSAAAAIGAPAMIRPVRPPGHRQALLQVWRC